MADVKHWIKAFRLRTLPLAMSSIGMGAFLAASENLFNFKITFLCITTTLFLQILSNLANDYGDYVSGVDGENRKGPSRLVQSGQITPDAMKKAMLIFTILSAISGLLLIYGENLLLFLPLGALSILGAITYTVGKKPYGYIGLGDFAVFFFFGLLAVGGTYYLQAHTISPLIFLPACASGFFSTAVLNINNIRDIESDKLSGKNSIPVRLGPQKARIYHLFLLVSGFLSALVFTLLNFSSIFQFLFLITLPMLIKNGKAIWTKYESKEIDPYLKQMSITTLIFVITFGIGILLK